MQCIRESEVCVQRAEGKNLLPSPKWEKNRKNCLFFKKAIV